MCSKEICPCTSIQVEKWPAYERAMLLGSQIDPVYKPVAYVNQSKKRSFYLKKDGFIETFG
jgi:hypothetical protein